MHLGGGNDWPWAGPLLAATPGMFTLTLVLVVPSASLRNAPEHVTKHSGTGPSQPIIWNFLILLVNRAARRLKTALALNNPKAVIVFPVSLVAFWLTE